MERNGQALFAFVRFWSRRWAGERAGAEARRGRDVMVLEAVGALAAAGRGTSINDVAHELGLDQSGASRMVAGAQERGLVTRQGADRVGAPHAVVATAAGERLLRDAHAWQDEVFTTLTAGWSDRDVRMLMTLMDRLVRAQVSIDG